MWHIFRVIFGGLRQLRTICYNAKSRNNAKGVQYNLTLFDYLCERAGIFNGTKNDGEGGAKVQKNFSKHPFLLARVFKHQLFRASKRQAWRFDERCNVKKSDQRDVKFLEAGDGAAEAFAPTNQRFDQVAFL